MTEASFLSELKDFNAICLELIQIGEKVNLLSPELYDDYPEVPWHELYGLRNRIVHGYDKINKDIKVVEKNGQKGKSINLIKRDEDEINSEKQNLIANRISKYKFNYKYTRTNSYYDFDVQNKDNKIDNAPKIFKKCSLCSKMLNFGDYKFNNENVIKNYRW